jgi:hypothetical protein
VDRLIDFSKISGMRETVVVCAGGQGAKGIEHRDGLTVVRVPLPEIKEGADEFSNHYSTYNRTALQEIAGSLIGVCQMVRQDPRVKCVVIVGQGTAGPGALMAAPAADAVAADCGALDTSSDEALLAPGVFAPGLRGIGGFEGAAMLAVGKPLLLHNTQGKLESGGIEAAYEAMDAEKRLVVTEVARSEEEILRWAAQD